MPLLNIQRLSIMFLGKELWPDVIKMGIPRHLMYVIHQLHKYNINIIRIEDRELKKEVRQGFVLCPLLFNLAMDTHKPKINYKLLKYDVGEGWEK